MRSAETMFIKSMNIVFKRWNLTGETTLRALPRISRVRTGLHVECPRCKRWGENGLRTRLVATNFWSRVVTGPALPCRKNQGAPKQRNSQEGQERCAGVNARAELYWVEGKEEFA